MDPALTPELEQIARIGGADLVIAILDSRHVQEAGDAAGLRQSMAAFRQLSQAVVICGNGASPGGVTPLGNGSSPAVFLCHLTAPATAETARETRARVSRSLITLGGQLKARACGLVAFEHDAATGEWLYRLMRPVLELGFDLVAPHYARRRMEGLLNRSILAPLHRALYGGRLHNPLGPDFGFSNRLLEQLPARDAARARGNEDDPGALVASAAVCGGFETCEAYLGPRSLPPADWTNVSGLVAEILGPVFGEMERRAAYWQRIRGSADVPRFGRRRPPRRRAARPT